MQMPVAAVQRGGGLPLGIIGIIMGIIFLRERQPARRTSFDIPGFACSAIGLTALLYGLSDASTDGWGSTKVIGFLAVGVLMLIAFVAVELTIIRRGGQPLLDLRVFANGPFTTSSIASVLVTFALFGGLFILPIYLQNLRGLSAFQAGLLLLPQAFASMVSSLLAGRLVDRFGVRPVIIPGLCILALALWLFSGLGPNTPYGTIQIWLIVRSLALGFCFQPLSVSALSEFGPNRLAQASSVSTTIRFVMSSFAVAVMATLVQTQTAVHYTHLAEMVTPSSQLGQLVPLLQAYFMQAGASASAAYAAAIQTINGIIEQRAAIMAMQDAFVFSLALTGIAIIAAFFVRFHRPQRIPAAERPAGTVEGESVETPAREEAMLAI